MARMPARMSTQAMRNGDRTALLCGILRARVFCIRRRLAREVSPDVLRKAGSPRYRTSGDSPSPNHRLTGAWFHTESRQPASDHALEHDLRRDDEFLVQNDPHLAAEQFKKNSNALAITHTFEQTEAIGEHAFAHAYFIAGRKLRPAPKLNKTLVIFPAFQTI